MFAFLSYRRLDSPAAVDRVYDYLAEEFDESDVFRDLGSLRPGDDFRSVIQERIKNCDVILVCIGERWIEKRLFSRNRLYEKNDIVRLEIETAHDLGKIIIPILLYGAPLPNKHDLPASIRFLLDLNVQKISRDPEFKTDITKLTQRLWQVRGEKRRPLRNLNLPDLPAKAIQSIRGLAMAANLFRNGYVELLNKYEDGGKFHENRDNLFLADRAVSVWCKALVSDDNTNEFIYLDDMPVEANLRETRLNSLLVQAEALMAKYDDIATCANEGHADDIEKETEKLASNLFTVLTLYKDNIDLFKDTSVDRIEQHLADFELAEPSKKILAIIAAANEIIQSTRYELEEI